MEMKDQVRIRARKNGRAASFLNRTLVSGTVSVMVAAACFGTAFAAEDREEAGVYTVSTAKLESGRAKGEYPVVTGVDGYRQESLDTINAFFKGNAEQAVAEQEEAVEASVEEMRGTPREEDIQFLGYELTCENLYLNGDLFSVCQYSSGYWGGAHGYGSSIGHSFDLASGTELSLYELLGCEESEGKERVVEAYRNGVIGYVQEVTEDDIRNAFDMMEYWKTEDGVIVSIPTYGVASYAAGPQEVILPNDGSPGRNLHLDYVMSEEDAAEFEARLDNGGASGQNAAGSGASAPGTLGGTSLEDGAVITVINGIQAPASDFILPQSSGEYLTAEDLRVLEGSSVEEEHYKSQLAINEILARYGYVFHPENGGAAKEAYDQFNGKSWYEQAKQYCPSSSANDMLYTYITKLELSNVDTICEWQKVHNCYY